MARSTARQPHAKLAQLLELARNLYWTWDAECLSLFAGIDPVLWNQTAHNPIRMIRRLSSARQAELAGDREFMAKLGHCQQKLQDYLRAPTWFDRQSTPLTTHPSPLTLPFPKRGAKLIAYFSMEYGLHESLPIYAGGLGILAGDHLKSASDLGIPLVAVGIFWKEGYTRQVMKKGGRQADRFPALDLQDAPMTEITDSAGRPLRLTLPMKGEDVIVRGWRVDVGRVPLVLLDTDIPGNKPAQRRLTSRLYIGDRDTRIRQEILLGIGGWQMLRRMGIDAAACHLNEGHAAFVSLERIADLMAARDLSFEAARKRVAATTVFTTHTPVPEGNETFDPAMVSAYHESLKLETAAFMPLGRVRPDDEKERFGMTPLALRTASRSNGVSALHGAVARRMWKGLWPGRKVDKVPIGSVTNGIHLRTWIHPRMAELLKLYLGEGWEDRQDEPRTWRAVSQIPDAVLFGLHHVFKAELIDFVRGRMIAGGGLSAKQVDSILDPDALTIGFARRFAAYKRAALIFEDPARLAKLVNDRERPVQILFAGKAHPADEPGKAVLQRVARFVASPKFRKRIVFIEDYEMDVARRMVAGVDVWLNNPRRPQEASGTSGMKPALHGGLNFSILDGWWPEAYDGKNGWAIGRGKDHDGSREADQRDAKDLYRVLEREIIPLYYDRDATGLPRNWITRMKHALMTIPPVFNSHRQVKEYWKEYYRPALRATD